MKLYFSIGLFTLIFTSEIHAQQSIDNVKPAEVVNSSSTVRATNAFIMQSLPSGAKPEEDGIKLTPISNVSAQTGAVILNFETENGFPKAILRVQSDGSVIRDEGAKQLKNSALIQESVRAIRFDSPNIQSLNIKWRAFKVVNKGFKDTDSVVEYNPPNGVARRHVFLLKDRDANDTASSGSQGLIAPSDTGISEACGGIYFTSEVDLCGFALILNNRHEDYLPLVAGFDADGNILFSASVGLVKGQAASFGVILDKANLRSVWVGQVYCHDGTFVDDVVLVPANKKQ